MSHCCLDVWGPRDPRRHLGDEGLGLVIRADIKMCTRQSLRVFDVFYLKKSVWGQVNKMLSFDGITVHGDPDTIRGHR